LNRNDLSLIKSLKLRLKPPWSDFWAAFGIALEVLDTVDMVLSVGELFLVIDPPVVEAIER
jgi:hypothetical protein